MTLGDGIAVAGVWGGLAGIVWALVWFRVAWARINAEEPE